MNLTFLDNTNQMKQLTSWHYLAILSAPFGILLSLLYASYGLLIFTLFNLVICYYCPDSFLFKKSPDGISQFSGKQFYKGGKSSSQLYLSTFLVIPLTTTILILAFSPKEIANFILGLSWLGVVNEDVVKAASYIIEGPVAVPNVDVQTLKELGVMRQDYPKRSLAIIVYRLIAYCFLPILITLSTFDRTREARSTFNFRNEKPASLSKRILGIGIALVILIGANYLCSAAYKTAYLTSNSALYYVDVAILVPPVFIIISWMFVLGVADQFISRPQTYFVKHPSAYELYLESKKVG